MIPIIPNIIINTFQWSLISLCFLSVFIIPQRYVLAIMSLFAIANAYTMRVCLNLAITQMVKRNVAVEGDANYDPNACTDYNIVSNETSSEEVFKIFRADEVSDYFSSNPVSIYCLH